MTDTNQEKIFNFHTELTKKIDSAFLEIKQNFSDLEKTQTEINSRFNSFENNFSEFKSDIKSDIKELKITISAFNDIKISLSKLMAITQKLEKTSENHEARIDKIEKRFFQVAGAFIIIAFILSPAGLRLLDLFLK